MISVIVPIYNVAKFLKKCLDSLLKQVYQDVEYILVDDGSTDESGEIAEQYQLLDARFKVYHTENQGLSAARNYGIEKARGNWLMFVDGDDWVTPNFCRTPINVANKYDADLVIFQHYLVKGNRKKKKYVAERPNGIVSTRTAIIYGGVAAWNKLYKRELFDFICYPEGRVHEDTATTHKVILASRKIVMIDDYLYNYVWRKNSISHTQTYQNKKEWFMAVTQRYRDLNKRGYSGDLLRKNLWETAISFLARVNPEESDVYFEAERIVNSVVGIPKCLSWRCKVALLIWHVNKNLFHMTCRIMKFKVV